MSAQAQTHEHAADFDAHGHKGHGHIIVSQWTLRAVLASLIFFTLFTSGAAYLEEFIAYTFQLDFPHWVNVVGAMSIAVIKTTLVVLFFMQLKYDNPLNSMIFIFTIIAVFLFLMFTLLDLGGRDTVYFYKAQEITYGGDYQGGEPIAEIGAKADEQKRAMKGGHAHHAGHGGHAPEYSSADRSRPVVGVTLEGYAPQDEHHDDAGHADEGGGH